MHRLDIYRAVVVLLLMPSALSRPVTWHIKDDASVTTQGVFDPSCSSRLSSPLKCDDKSPTKSAQTRPADHVLMSHHPLGDSIWHATESLHLAHLRPSFEPWLRLWISMMHHLGKAASRLGNELEELKDFVIHAVDDAPPTPNDEGEYVDWYDGADAFGELWRSADEDGYDSLRPRQPPLLFAVALAALAVGLFSFWCLHVRTVDLCVEEFHRASK
ncbi:hypothetical protein CP532_6360 [Ophiocordyceps camponoti-leonardi (nom. inval.)]|nr:hypothetical protein CP532_6360 [Ophiocordyceps camponoti-leonardi (nom. inval.)]